MIVAFALFLAAVVAAVILGWNLTWAIAFGLAVFSVLGLRRGFSPKALAAMAWKKGKDALIVVPVFLLIGTVTALWRASGTISFFLYYGLSGIPKSWFLLVAFALSALLSFALGTSYGVTGTAGVVLITLARSGGVSVAAAAGAILSGAYFGDRCSPMSSCATLVAACTGTKLYPNVREMLKTAALPTILTAAIFAVISVRNHIAVVDAAVLDTLRDNFSLNALVLLPAALMLALPLFKVPVKWAMAASSAAAFALAVFMQQLPVLVALKTAIFGYAPASQSLADILSGGGMCSMITSCLVVFLTSLYAGILEGIDALSPLKFRVEHLAKKLGLFPATAIVSALVVAVFCNQSVMVIMDEQLLADSYEKRGRSRLERAMDIANSGVTIAGLVPWSIALTVPLTMLDADLSAVPYAVLLYMIPLCYLITKKWFAPAQNTAFPAEVTRP
jgi:NhaC family Na+:H+ antiporter